MYWILSLEVTGNLHMSLCGLSHTHFSLYVKSISVFVFTIQFDKYQICYTHMVPYVWSLRLNVMMLQKAQRIARLFTSYYKNIQRYVKHFS